MTVIKWRDTAWKEVLSDCAQGAIEYLMPDLAADMDLAIKRGVQNADVTA